MIGIEISGSGKDVVDQLRERNILINSTNENTIRLLPPLIATKTEIDIFLESFYKVVEN